MDSSGSYISHDILHSARRKRSPPSSQSSLHYHFSAFGREMHLELKPSDFFSYSFTVQVLGKDGIADLKDHHVEPCFYQGFIRNYSSSSVAISTCVGLVSVFFKGVYEGLDFGRTYHFDTIIWLLQCSIPFDPTVSPFPSPPIACLANVIVSNKGVLNYIIVCQASGSP